MSYKKYILPAILGMLLFPPETSAIIPDRNYIRLPQDAGLIYRKLDVTTSDGLRIETWFYPAQDFCNRKSGIHQNRQRDYIKNGNNRTSETVTTVHQKR